MNKEHPNEREPVLTGEPERPWGPGKPGGPCGKQTGNETDDSHCRQ